MSSLPLTSPAQRQRKPQPFLYRKRQFSSEEGAVLLFLQLGNNMQELYHSGDRATMEEGDNEKGNLPLHSAGTGAESVAQ